MSGNPDSTAVVAEKGHDDTSKLKTFLSILRKYDHPEYSSAIHAHRDSAIFVKSCYTKV
jgi:hypothetical protein